MGLFALLVLSSFYWVHGSMHNLRLILLPGKLGKESINSIFKKLCLMLPDFLGGIHIDFTLNGERYHSIVVTELEVDTHGFTWIPRAGVFDSRYGV